MVHYNRKIFFAGVLMFAWTFAAAAAEPEKRLSPSTFAENAPSVEPLAAFEGSDPDAALRLGTRATISFGGQQHYDRSQSDPSAYTYSAGFNYDFSHGLSLRGSYIMQDLPEWNMSSSGVDSPRAWKLGFGVSQERLRFTSLMVEYGQLGAGFYLPGNTGAFENNFSSPLSNSRRGFSFADNADVWFMGARQSWNSRFSTFQQYARYDERNSSGVRQWTVGVGYRYSPGLYMEVAYDNQQGALDTRDYNDRRVRLRTMINF